MPTPLPQLQSYKNVEKLFQRIKTAKQPEAFTHAFLYDTLGLKAVGDRPLIAFLRTLGFLDGSNHPTPEYSALKNDSEASRAIGRAIRRAYAPLFAADENAHKLDADKLRGLVAQVAGSDANNTAKIVGTLNALLRIANLSDTAAYPAPPPTSKVKTKENEDQDREELGALRTEFHYNFQIHLPANATEESYLNIFSALRKVFK